MFVCQGLCLTRYTGWGWGGGGGEGGLRHIAVVAFRCYSVQYLRFHYATGSTIHMLRRGQHATQRQHASLRVNMLHSGSTCYTLGVNMLHAGNNSSGSTCRTQGYLAQGQHATRMVNLLRVNMLYSCYLVQDQHATPKDNSLRISMLYSRFKVNKLHTGITYSGKPATCK